MDAIESYNTPNPVVQCHGKERFESFELASRVAKQSCRRRECRMMAYRCPSCKGWHIGSAGRKEARRHG